MNIEEKLVTIAQNEQRVFDAGTRTTGAVTYTPQTLTEERQAQARENIGVSTYYHTEREEVGAEHDEINAAYIWGLYDALMAEYPNNVKKHKFHSNDGTFTNYTYEISTGEYPVGAYANEYVHRATADEHIKKPKYLILSAVDGNERKTAFSTYRFIRDVLRGHNVPKCIKEDAIISVMPIGVPYAFDKFGRINENDVYIERNFAFGGKWPPKLDTNVNPGTGPESEKETQAISNWLRDNSDAGLYISVHNSGAVHELASIIGVPNNVATDAAKKIALRGIGKVAPYWRDVIGYSTLMSTDGERADIDGDGVNEDVIKKLEVIFATSMSMNLNGTSVAFAQNVLGIPSLLLETSSYYGDYEEWEENKTAYPAETIAMGAEAIGNILIEFYEQASEVIAMNEANAKLDALLQSATFRVVKGTYIPGADEHQVNIADIPTNAKVVEIRGTTTKSTSVPFYASFITYTAAPNNGEMYATGKSKNLYVEYWVGDRWANSPFQADNSAGLSFELYAAQLLMEGGTAYEWTAYCWD